MKLKNNKWYWFNDELHLLCLIDEDIIMFRKLSGWSFLKYPEDIPQSIKQEKEPKKYMVGEIACLLEGIKGDVSGQELIDIGRRIKKYEAALEWPTKTDAEIEDFLGKKTVKEVEVIWDK